MTTGRICLQEICGSFIYFNNHYKLSVSSKPEESELSSFLFQISFTVSFSATYHFLKNIRVNSDSVTDLKVSFVSNCQYSRSDSICPVCKKIDKVIPIVYGLIVFENDENDTTANSSSIIEEEQSFRMGGCNVTGCDPFWYCRRDSISF